jgi:hypothetical protein
LETRYGRCQKAVGQEFDHPSEGKRGQEKRQLSLKTTKNESHPYSSAFVAGII